MDNQYFKVRIQTKYDSRKRRIKKTINFGLCLIMIIGAILLFTRLTNLTLSDFLREVRVEAMSISSPEPKKVQEDTITKKKREINTVKTRTVLIRPATDGAIRLSYDNKENEINHIEKSAELKSIIPFAKQAQKVSKNDWNKAQKQLAKEARRQKILAEKRRKLRIKRKREKLARLRRRNAKYVPEGFGKTLAYMKWDCVTAKGTPQYRLKSAAEHYNSKGMGMVNGRFTIAIKPYYGAVGDYLDITFADGTIMKAIVVDEKGEENEPGKGNYSNIYASSNRRQLARGVTDKVHTDGSVLEFVVDGEGKTTGWRGFAGYNGHKTVGKLYPQFAQNIKYISKMGNFWK